MNHPAISKSSGSFDTGERRTKARPTSSRSPCSELLTVRVDAVRRSTRRELSGKSTMNAPTQINQSPAAVAPTNPSCSMARVWQLAQRPQVGSVLLVRFARSSIRKLPVCSRPNCCRSEGGDGRLKAAAAAITVFVSVYQK